MVEPKTPEHSIPGSVLDHLLEGCQVISRDYRYLYVNDAATQHARADGATLVGKKMAEAYPGIEETEMFAVLRQTMTGGEASSMENEFSYPDGSRGWFELRFEPVPDGVVILSVDITHRKRVELALRRTMRALKTLSSCNHTLIRAIDERQFLEDVCQIIVESGGYPIAWIALAESVDGIFPGAEEPRNMALTYGFIPPDMVLLHAQDVTEQRQIEEQLVAGQRLEAVGRLAGGVAHDFNNLLSVILMYAAFVTEQLPEGDPIREEVAHIEEAGERAAVLTRQLLAFSRKQIMETKVVDLNSVVEGLESMIRRLIGEQIDVEVRVASDLRYIRADTGHLEQVLMNLVVNARDAMPDGGKLTIETANVELDEDYVHQHVEVEPGRYACLFVTDTGEGMSAETKNHIFEPFFTTKKDGKGTGLGLATVYGIVKQSGGHVWVYSEPGHGTVFKIYLPCVDAVPSRVEPGEKLSLGKGDETILVVEDEEAVRNAARRILEASGYQVLTASDGLDALQQREEHDGGIDLLLTDVIMPRMTGRELSEQIEKLDPGLRVIYTSGYTDNAIARHGVLEPGTRFLGKPFTADDLLRKVREALDAK